MVGIDEETFHSFRAETILREHAGDGSSDYLSGERGRREEREREGGVSLGDEVRERDG